MTQVTHHQSEAPPARGGRGRRGLRAAGRGRVVAVAMVAVTLAGAAGAWVWLRGTIGDVPLRPHCTATALGQSTELDPEQAGNAATITAVALRRGLPGRAATIGIATAMQESKLRNLEYGDRDSLGLFQQRPSQGWGTAEQVMDPVYASNAFYDVLVKVEGYQSLPITDAAQKVQRSAFPSAYQDHEGAARIFASTLSGYSTASLSCVLRAPGTLAKQVPGSGGLTARAAAVAKAAAAETGRQGTALTGGGGPGDPAGTAVRFAVTGKDDVRLAWALAQWAVARAEALDVVTVEVDGRQWRRSDVSAGWTPLATGTATQSAAGTDAGSGVVVVRVAPGT